jgi:hypothetical protein
MLPSMSRADETIEVRLGVTVDADEQRAFGRVAIRFANRGRAPLDAAYVWLYPNRLRRAHDAREALRASRD